MPSFADVARIANGLPEVAEGTTFHNRAWKVRKRTFCWERPLGKKDAAEMLAATGTVPEGELLAVRVEDEGAKAALLADPTLPCFTIPHFDGYSAILVRLDDATEEQLVELITEAWLVKAPPTLRRQLRD